ncbi:conserved hypothetical integral membrane protein [Seinonella peptonophila]|uniref:Conserved hypothetical integral membrane protein n=1 Tax=Seinonella peptonophila TaxID=112248 RepID=A0A1M4XSN4_9BACL|nr:DUF1146 family protein [Seinonella peptonophila]SHE96567.1 conserved hypothetical integral membrane protein [Seinonella peptonophila]
MMEGTTAFGVNALINLFLSLICIVVSWRILMFVRIEELLRVKRPGYAKALMILLSVVMGHMLANFFIDYLSWTRQISQMFL